MIVIFAKVIRRYLRAEITKDAGVVDIKPTGNVLRNFRVMSAIALKVST